MKRFKILLTTCLIICVAAFACVLGACGGGNDDNKEPVTEVTVTVLLADNTPAVGVMVGLCATTADGVGTCLTPKPTADNGKIAIDVTRINTGDIEIHLTNVPDGYIYADANGNEYVEFTGLQIPNTQSEVTITLKATA